HVVRGLAERALALDADYSNGATHELMISLESLDELVGGSEARAREHFKRAVELQKGQPQAGPYFSLATGIALKNQNRDEFEQLLKEALAMRISTRRYGWPILPHNGGRSFCSIRSMRYFRADTHFIWRPYVTSPTSSHCVGISPVCGCTCRGAGAPH